MDSILNKSEKTLILVDNQADLETLYLLSRLNFLYSKSLKIKTVNTPRLGNFKEFISTNSFLSKTPIDNSLYLFVATNPKIEAAVLNAKIRMEYNSKDISVFAAGPYFVNSMPTSVLFTNTYSILKIVEGKQKELSLINKGVNYFIVVGESILQRGLSKGLIYNLFKSYNKNIQVLELVTGCNTNGHILMPLDNVSKKDLQTAKNIFCLNLKSSLFLKKNLQNKYVAWFNTHGSSIAKSSNLIIPTLTAFETESIYLNIESRPQKTQSVIKNFYNAKDIKKIIYAIFNKNILMRNAKELLFVYEYLEDSFKFDKGLNLSLNLNSKQKESFLSKYPVKSIFEDFYQTNTLSVNSRTMAECSRAAQKVSTNFNKRLED